MNRRGLGVHLTFESFGTQKPIDRTGSVYQEALAAAARAPSGATLDGSGKKKRNRKVLILAFLSLIQGLVVVVNEIFDVVGALHP